MSASASRAAHSNKANPEPGRGSSKIIVICREQKVDRGSGLRDSNPWSQLWESCMLPLHQTRAVQLTVTIIAERLRKVKDFLGFEQGFEKAGLCS